MKTKIETAVNALTPATEFYYGSKYEFNVQADDINYPVALLLPLKGNITFQGNSMFDSYDVLMMFIDKSAPDQDYDVTKINIDKCLVLAKAFLNKLINANNFDITESNFEEFDGTFNQWTCGIILQFSVKDNVGQATC